MTDSFPMLTISGTAEERGAAHGASLKEGIAANIAFYSGMLRLPETDIHSIGRYYREQIYIAEHELGDDEGFED